MKDTSIPVFIVGAAPAGGVPIVFPTALLPITQSTNTTVAVGPGVDVAVLAANALRKFAQIQNANASALTIAFGAAGTANSFTLPAGSVWTSDPDTIGEINQQAIHVFNPTAGALNVTVVEF